jgi:hypothetical protein
VKYPDGLAVKVVNNGEFKPGQYAAKPNAPKFIKMTFTVTNGTSKPFDPVVFYATMQSGNTEAEQVFDSQAKMGMSPNTPVLPGREVTWVTGWGVSDPNDLVMSVAPGPFEYDKIIFTSK